MGGESYSVRMSFNGANSLLHMLNERNVLCCYFKPIDNYFLTYEILPAVNTKILVS
jgi:hypothetical protein